MFIGVFFGADVVAAVTPDILSSAIVLVASAMLVRFVGGRMGAIQAALMGAALGIGYIAKTILLPFAFVVMMTMLAVEWGQTGRKRMICVTL